MAELLEKILSTFGFNALLLIAVGYGFYKLVNYVLKHNERRENDLMALIHELRKSFDERTEQDKQYQMDSREAHKFQKQEHESLFKIIDHTNKVSESLIEKVAQLQ